MNRYPGEMLIFALRRFVASRPAPWTQDDFLATVEFGHNPIRRLFGSWEGAVRAVGGPAADEYGGVGRKKWTRQRLMAAAREHIRPGEEITQHEFCRRAGISRDTLRRVYGRWELLREECGGVARRGPFSCTTAR